MKRLITIILIIICTNNTYATTILASTFGYNPVDATTAFQAAILSPNDTIIIDLQAEDWNVGPSIFFNLVNKTIIFQQGVKLKAISGTFNNIYACLLELKYCNNVQIIGYQAEFKMNKAEYAALANSEYRMSININDCKNISIKGLLLNESGGDGIVIGGQGVNYSENIVIEDVTAINHYRQGMSVINVQNMTVKNCRFANTSGTLPEAGVDVEPDTNNQRLINLQFENCVFENNGWAGIALALFQLDSTSLPISITIKDCYFKNNCKPTNSYDKGEIFFSADDLAPVQGNVMFERCFIEESQYTAVYTRKTSNAYAVKFKDCVFQNVSELQIPNNEPIFFEVPSYTNPSNYVGGVEFDNVFISYSTNFSFFKVNGWTTLQGVKNITGKFTVVEQNNNLPTYTNVPDTVNVTYTFTNQTLLPPTTVNLNATVSQAVECTQQHIIYNFNRASLDNSYPLGIKYANTGTVTFGDDVHLMTGGFVIPANSSTRTDSIITRQDLTVEPLESITLTILPNSTYAIPTNSINATIADCIILGINSEQLKDLIIYPNPSTGIFTISQNNTNNKIEIEIYNSLGKLIYKATKKTAQEIIDFSIQPKGIYLIRLTDSKSQKSIKLIKH